MRSYHQRHQQRRGEGEGLVRHHLRRQDAAERRVQRRRQPVDHAHEAGTLVWFQVGRLLGYSALGALAAAAMDEKKRDSMLWRSHQTSAA